MLYCFFFVGRYVYMQTNVCYHKKIAGLISVPLITTHIIQLTMDAIIASQWSQHYPLLTETGEDSDTDKQALLHSGENHNPSDDTEKITLLQNVVADEPIPKEGVS